ncbi:MAG: 50S ribosomal protein L24 [Actinobacteria bacterium]|jgi:large subunit ribosomal protein L24|nr:50S ribosomal protein L24 [Actinomycetota bacterium]MCL5445669.1 50S ribosomal protein L24 [Actinomycetota bacterium]
MRIKKGDRVVVRSGKYKGHRSEVIRALPAEGRVVLEGVNVAKRHAKATGTTMQGGIIDKFMPVPVSSVSLLCKSCGEPTRVGSSFDEHGRKLRVCRRCEAEL